AVLVELLEQLRDARGDGHLRLEPEHVADLVEAHLVVAGVLVALDVGDLALVGELADLLDEVKFAVVLAAAANVEHVAGDDIARRVKNGGDPAAGVANVHVWSPELLTEYLELAVRPQVACEFVDSEVEAHPWGDAIDGGEAQTRRLQRVAVQTEEHLLAFDLL